MSCNWLYSEQLIISKNAWKCTNYIGLVSLGCKDINCLRKMFYRSFVIESEIQSTSILNFWVEEICGIFMLKKPTYIFTTHACGVSLQRYDWVDCGQTLVLISSCFSRAQHRPKFTKIRRILTFFKVNFFNVGDIKYNVWALAPLLHDITCSTSPHTYISLQCCSRNFYKKNAFFRTLKGSQRLPMVAKEILKVVLAIGGRDLSMHTKTGQK